MSDRETGRHAFVKHGIHENEDVVFVPLTQGRKAIVDAAVWARIAKRFGTRWFLNSNGHGGVYARKQISRPDGTIQGLTLARAVTGARKGERIEALNHNALDCRRSNLRVVEPKEAAKTRREFADKRRPQPEPRP